MIAYDAQLMNRLIEKGKKLNLGLEELFDLSITIFCCKIAAIV